MICFILVFGFSITYANIIPNEEIGKNSIEIKLLKTEMQAVVQTIVRFFFKYKKSTKTMRELT